MTASMTPRRGTKRKGKTMKLLRKATAKMMNTTWMAKRSVV